MNLKIVKMVNSLLHIFYQNVLKKEFKKRKGRFLGRTIITEETLTGRGWEAAGSASPWKALS